MSKRERNLARKILTRALERMRRAKDSFQPDAPENIWYADGIATLFRMIAYTEGYARFR